METLLIDVGERQQRRPTGPLRGPGKRSWSAVPGLRKEREGAPPAVGLRGALQPCTPPARGYLTQYSAVRWEAAPWVRAKLGTPLVEEPRGWIAQGALAVTPLGKGRAAKNAAECDSQRAPCAKKRVCAVQAHSDTTALDTRWHSHSDSPHTQCTRSMKQRVTRVPTTRHV